MATYSEQDLRYAAEFREDVHRDALAILRRTRPDITEVVDRYGVEDYFQEHWDYPGKWYTIVAVPADSGGRKALVDTIVRDTLAQTGAPTEERPDDGGDAADEPQSPATGDDALDALLAQYPGVVAEYAIVKPDVPYLGYESHRRALLRASERLVSGVGWSGDARLAVGKRIDAAELFSGNCPKGALNYRRAFLYPPHGSGCTGRDFDRVNAALFPNGTDALEACAWTTDWSDYFDDGREWWGTLCLTVYDPSLDRFAVILASATD